MEGALYVLIKHEQRVGILTSEMPLEVGVSLFKMPTLF
jgi:hypothetical protein